MTRGTRASQGESSTMHRRDVLTVGSRLLAGLAMGAAMAPLAGLRASASQWPTKPIRVIVPYAAGSATDLIPRTVFEAVSAQVGQPVVVEVRLVGVTTVG